MRYLNIFLALVLWASVAGAETEYYVWVDENGITNYSERSPMGYDAQHVSRTRQFGEQVFPEEQESRGSRPGSVPEIAPERGAESAATAAPASKIDPDKMVDQERAAIAKELSATKRQNCDIGKRNLAQLQAFARIRVKGDDGKERVLTTEEHQGRIQEARQVITENCSA